MLKPEEALANWKMSGKIQESPDQGLINHTWLINDPADGVLQWVNPIFDHRIHFDLMAITEHVLSKGMCIPRLMELPDGQPCLIEEKGCWRIWEFIPGSTIHKIKSHNIAEEAGRIVGEFHRAMSDFSHTFVAPSRDAHNTPARMLELSKAMDNSSGHPLESEANRMAQDILKAWEAWEGELDLPDRICHGDLKISNLRFDKEGKKAVCLLDLDTIGRQSFSVELGDAWRSWCNPAGEEKPEESRFDVEVFRSSARAWLKSAPPLEQIELETLVCGIERICLELSARFCADSINNSYFKEDRVRFPVPGSHNLTKARSQYNLARSVLRKRKPCEDVIRKTIKEMK